MDIDLLAKMVREAILDHDAVTLPGVGSFVAELIPSSFSDKGYTIHPPYRRLYFSPKQGNDTLLAGLYADANGVDLPTATRILTEFLAEMKEVLKVRKIVVFPGLGRLRATRENHFFFVADEDLDIYPEGFGLSPVSLKTHVETPDEVASAVAGLAELMSEPVADIEEIPAPEPEPEGQPESEPEAQPEPEPEAQPGPEPESEPVPEPEPQPDPVPEPESAPEPILETMPETTPEPQSGTKPEAGFQPSPAVKKMYRSEYRTESKKHHHHHRRRKAWRVVAIIACIILFLLAAFIAVGHLFPHALDWLLYSGEELEIVRLKY